MTEDSYPTLTDEQLFDARLYADRRSLVRHLELPVAARVAEVGVGLGDFSAFLLEVVEPAVFTGIDVFTLHEIPELWGRSTEEIFAGATHEEYYRERFPAVDVRSGSSCDLLPALADDFYDLMYIDAAHDYASVKLDAELAVPKVRRGGYLVFNDYTLYDPFLRAPYGVVPAVNELVCGSDWRVVGFALEHNMFCDIALRRS